MKLNQIRSLTVVLGLFLLSPAARAADPFEENIRPTEPLTPEQEQKTFHLPPGFEIQLVAAEPDLRKPMNMAFDAAGRLWITESREYPLPAKDTATARDTIRIFSDFDASGRARTVTTFATNLNIPIGIYPFRSPPSADPKSAKLTWKCIAWSIPNIWLFEDTDGDGKADKKEILYGPFDATRDTHGNQASFRRGFDGWLYATHGFNNDSHVKGRDGHEIHLNSGNTYRLRVDGSRIEQHTYGQVNPFGLTFDPLGNLYSADCHSSPIYQLLRGAHYPSFGKSHDGLGFAPVTIQHSHGSTAICGITHISDPSWPAEFQGNLFIGNVMTSRINRDRIEWRGSTSVGHEMPDFLTTDDPWFRPVDMQFGPDGALYVADFYNRIIGHYEVPLLHPGRDRERGRIWRIVYRGATGTSLTDFTRKTGDELSYELMSGNPARRSLAMNELAVRVDDKTTGTLQQAARGLWHFRQGDDRTSLMIGALWLLQRRDALDDETVKQALMDGNSAVRVHALRILAERGLQAASTRTSQSAGSGLKLALRAALIDSLLDGDAFVQRAAAEALAQYPEADAVKPLLQLLGKAPAADTHLRHVARMALRNQLTDNAVFEKVMVQNWPEPELRALADVSLAVKSESAALFLMRHEASLSGDAELHGRLLEHAARYAPVTALDALAETAQKQKADDFDFQLTLFQTVQQGFTQRGVALTPKIREWGTGLAHKLLAAAASTGAIWGNTPLDGVRDPRNPWTFQERLCADGQKAQVLSSLPLGEQLTGVLRSAPFALPAQLSFYLCGHDGFPQQPAGKKNFVRLRLAVSSPSPPHPQSLSPAGVEGSQFGRVIREVSPPRNDTAQKITWDLAEFAGKRGFIEVVDADNANAYAWLAFGRFEPALPQLALVDPNQVARGQKAGAELAQSLKLLDLLPRLTGLLQGTGTDYAVRAAAASAVASLKGDGLLSALAGALTEPVVPEEVKRALTAAIAGDAANVSKAVETAMQSAPARVQQKLALTLAGTPAGAELLLVLTETGKVAPRVLAERAVKDRLAAVKPARWETRVAKLTVSLPPEDATRQKQIDARRVAFDPAKASAAKGAEIFTKTCAVCHQIDGQGVLIGPQLDGVGGRGVERLIEDILDPNRNVDSAFRSSTFVLTDGEVVSGLFRREEGELLILAEASGKEISVPKKQVKARRESESSLMPDNFADVISPEDFNDLLAYLVSKVGK